MQFNMHRTHHRIFAITFEALKTKMISSPSCMTHHMQWLNFFSYTIAHDTRTHRPDNEMPILFSKPSRDNMVRNLKHRFCSIKRRSKTTANASINTPLGRAHQPQPTPRQKQRKPLHRHMLHKVQQSNKLTVFWKFHAWRCLQNTRNTSQKNEIAMMQYRDRNSSSQWFTTRDDFTFNNDASCHDVVNHSRKNLSSQTTIEDLLREVKRP
jgi:hypothetical protein